MPFTLLAAMEMPMPVVQITIPRSHAPEATASAAARAASSVSAATTATRSPMVSGSVVSTFSSAIRSGEGGLPEQLK